MAGRAQVLRALRFLVGVDTLDRRPAG